ncbi:uncharacterized protein LOC135498142 [Lineus longissimus]|uniref:uncharacterized protein LOC135498142 n=1 Tax=Lineus longissimus TaxID=88925 RepID=UPI002B4E4979
MKEKTPKMPAGGVVDVEDIILQYARKWFEDLEQRPLEKKFGKLPWEQLSVEVDRTRLIVEHDNALHEKEQEDQAVGEYSPRHSVLFKSNYENTTGSPLNYQICTERRTRTSVALTITKGFCFGAGFEIKLGPPALEANLGLSSELSFEKSVQTTKEQEVSWTLNTQVNVPPHTRTTVELVVKDDEYKGTFGIRSYFSGKIYVDVSKDNTQLTRLIIGDLKQIFKEEMGFKRCPKSKRIYFDTHGICNCRYGVEQQVKISETPIPIEGE